MENRNLYAPPESEIEEKRENLVSDSYYELIDKLSYRNTWALLFLTLITVGIYSAHYMKRQSVILNSYNEKRNEVSISLVYLILVFSYLSLLSLIPLFLLEEGHPINAISKVFDTINTLLVLVWAFIFRSKLHLAIFSKKREPQWLNAFWTFLFQFLYINFKINNLQKLALIQK